MDEAGLSLVVHLPAGAAPIRYRITRALTTIGSDAGADICIGTLPSRWALVQRRGEVLTVRELATGSVYELALGRSITLDSVTLALEGAPASRHDEGLPLNALSESLAAAESPESALGLLLRGLIQSTHADGGAVILKEGEGYTVAAAETSDQRPLLDAEALLSDTIVNDVLQGGSKLLLADVDRSARYAGVPSVVSLRLRSVLCVPMRIGEGIIGAIFLGRRDVRAAFTERHSTDLEVLATMAVPLLVQLRRFQRHRPAGIARVEELLLGDCGAMRSVRDLVRRAAPSDLTVLIHGETGTGKERCALAIHNGSARAERPMVTLNCAAVPEGLLASELFGVKKGAFTGAVADRVGRIEQAHGSTLFLDEVGDMPLAMQAALLRVLEQRTVTRVGDTVERPVDFRLVAATHKDLDAEAQAERFRSDMLFRLREITVILPPLRERGDDVTLLASLFLRQIEHQLALPPKELDEEAMEALRSYGWPGNVRELRAAVRRSAVLSRGRIITAEDLQLQAFPLSQSPEGGRRTWREEELERSLAEARDAFIRDFVSAVVEKNKGNREAAAAALGISLRSLYRHLAGGTSSG